MPSQSKGANTSISLPKGGGAIKGIGETFQPNLFSGTGNFSVPIFTSSGRNGFGPQLTVQYSTGNGNGPFGLGWQLSLPRITRKTEKGLPTYKDQDVFVMSGAEDLVPHLQQVNGNPNQWEAIVTGQDDPESLYRISLYRPRTEGLFARIERWEKKTDNDVHWRAITKDNVTSIYGQTDTSRIVDPDNANRVYEWLIEETFDAKGNHMLYEYVQEDATLQLPGIHEHKRSYTQAYIRRILYGNTPENLDVARKIGPIRTATDHSNSLLTRERHYLFEVLFDYQENSENLSIAADPSHEPEHKVPANWPVREDPFSSFRSGFEIRTLRRCQRVLMRHHFNEGELVGASLVKSTDFQYSINLDTQLSFLTSATVSGYRRDPNGEKQYIKRSLPPVTFKYSEFKPQEQRYQSVTAKGRDLPPRSIDAPNFTIMDIFGNGLPDILNDTGGGFHYWENLGQGQLDRRHPQHGSQPVHTFAEPNVSIGDMGGDGLADLVVDAPPISGFYESTPDGQWKTFKRFQTMPSFNLSDPNTRLLDLTGDGLSDVLVTRDSHFLWFRCKGEAGYDEPLRNSRKHDLDLFPDVFFDDPAGRVRLADMTGDGLNDIVLVHDGRIDYWPNLGYGQFGRRITMANTPRIGYDFDPRRLFLADLDGSGSADLVYVEHCRIRFWFNRSGNGWSEKQTVDGTPNISDLTSVQFTDFYGTGTTTLLWSYDFGQHPGGRNYKILDFCGGKKPNLLVEMDNNMGATTRVQFAPSTKFYLEDKAKGTPWHTSLPFPVQVLEKTEVIDHISKTKLVTSYKYHHGYYDGREREFRGFGRVDQFDTEFFEDFSSKSLHGDEVTFDNRRKGFHVPPVETRTWFHTGVYFDDKHYLDHRELTEKNRNEFYSGDAEAFQLEAHSFELPDGSEGRGDSPHEAFRALRGAVLRTEVYGRDSSDKTDHPYTVTETRYQVKALQPRNDNNHAVYLTNTSESLSYHYERNPADPRISHSITLGIDDFGNVTDSVAIGYPRRVVPGELPEQGETQIVYSRTDFINPNSPPSADADFYYAGIPFQSRQYEVTGKVQPDLAQFSASQFLDIRDTTAIVDTQSFKPYESVRNPADTDAQRRIIEWTRSYFRSNTAPDLIDPIGSLDHRLALGEIESLALPYETYQAAFTKGMLQQFFGDRITGMDLPREGGYHPHPDLALSEGDGSIGDYLWIPSGRQGFDSEKFLQANHTQDPFGNTASAESDVYALLVETARDALPGPMANVIAAKNDYRVLQAFEMTDPNGNHSQVAFDALGLVVGTAIMGEDEQGNPLGDSLEGFIADLSNDVRNQHINDPLNLDAINDTNPHNILNKATTRLVYDLKRFIETETPNVVYTLVRETHVSDEQGTPSKIQHTFVYSDGFGRESQSKVQAEPDNAAPTISRWVGTGTIIYNNKGKAVQQFEPFFSNDHRHGIERHGVSPTLFYDPLGRVVCTVNPNQTYEKVLFDPWQQTSWDSNDTVLQDPRFDPDIIQYVDDYFQQFDQAFVDEQGESPETWFQARIFSNDTAIKLAAEKTQGHADTPTVTHLDTLARPFFTITDIGLDILGNEQKFPTRVVLDIEGNQLEVIDAKDRIVMHYDYNILSAPIHQSSMEAGQRWMLNDVTGQSIRAWDNRGNSYLTEFDQLRRPLRAFVTGADPENSSQQVLTERMIYGEQHPQAESRNLRGSLYLHFETAGVVSVDAIDFKGNPLRASRRLATEYKKVIDWRVVEAALPVAATAPIAIEMLEPTLSMLLETDTYTSTTSYDALNRPIEITSPHTPTMQASIIRPAYNEANLLEGVEANLLGTAVATAFVTNIDYDAKGQRQRIDYGSVDDNGNRVSTLYDYDQQTFRLIRMRTLRGVEALQNLQYTYDPVGNITHIRDDAQQTHYFNNAVVVPHTSYTYDAMYRLIEATGREHLAQNRQPIPHSFNDSLRSLLPHPSDGDAMGTYTERYLYDAVGNFLEMHHRGNNPNNPGWARTYNYQEPSQIESGKQNNRLSGTVIGATSEAYSTNGDGYDTHGNMLRLPHLSVMHWNYRDQLQTTARQVVNNGNPETTRYVYDASGERVRKLTEQANGQLKHERIYFGGFEIFRKYNVVDGSVKLERETLHIMDDSQRIALVETHTQGNQPVLATQLIRYQFGNHLGSASLELDHAAKIISYEEYTPYGCTSYQAGRSQAEVKRKQYRYTGMERDEESGFSYHSARYYLPWLGRWVSADPAGLVDGLNLYRYGRGSPIRFSDSTGGNSEQASKAEDQLITVREEEGSLKKNRDIELNNKSKIESKNRITKKTVENMQREIKDYVPESTRRGDRIGNEKIQKLYKLKLDHEESIKELKRTERRLREIDKQLGGVEARIKKQVRKVKKLGGNTSLQAGDIKTSDFIDEAVQEVEDFLDGVETENLQTDDFLDEAYKELDKEGFGPRDEFSSKKPHVSNTPDIKPSRFISGKTILRGLPLVGLIYQQSTWDKDTSYSGSRLEDLIWGETVAQIWEIPMAAGALGALLGAGMAADAKISVKNAFGPGIHEYDKPMGASMIFLY